MCLIVKKGLFDWIFGCAWYPSCNLSAPSAETFWKLNNRTPKFANLRDWGNNFYLIDVIYKSFWLYTLSKKVLKRFQSCPLSRTLKGSLKNWEWFQKCQKWFQKCDTEPFLVLQSSPKLKNLFRGSRGRVLLRGHKKVLLHLYFLECRENFSQLIWTDLVMMLMLAALAVLVIWR